MWAMWLGGESGDRLYVVRGAASAARVDVDYPKTVIWEPWRQLSSGLEAVPRRRCVGGCGACCGTRMRVAACLEGRMTLVRRSISLNLDARVFKRVT